MIKYLSQWIKHNVAIMSDRSFPNNPVELKVLLLLHVFMGFILHNFTLHATVLERSGGGFFFLFLFVLQALYSQYLQFKDYDIPLKEHEKTKIKNLYEMLEVHTHTEAFCCLPCVAQRGDTE